MTTERAPRFDKRVERSRSTVLAETYRQLSQGGIGGVSIDEISRQSGVSKTTIYRHWPSRSALLMEACSSFGAAAPIPDTGSLRSDLLALLTGLADQLGGGPWSSVYPSILDAAEREPDITALQSQLHRSFMAPLEVVLDRARDIDESLLRGRTTSEIVAALVGPLFFRRWFSREAITEEFVVAILDTALR